MSFWTTPLRFRDPDDPPVFALFVGRALVVLGVLLCALPLGGALVYLFDGSGAAVLSELLSPPALLGIVLLIVGLLTTAVGHLHVLAWHADQGDD